MASALQSPLRSWLEGSQTDSAQKLVSGNWWPGQGCKQLVKAGRRLGFLGRDVRACHPPEESFSSLKAEQKNPLALRRGF